MHAIYFVIFIVFASAGSHLPVAVARQLLSSYKIKIKPIMDQSDEFQSAIGGANHIFEVGSTDSTPSNPATSQPTHSQESTTKSRSEGAPTSHESSSPNPHNPSSSPPPTPKSETTTKLTSEGTPTAQKSSTQHANLTTFPPTPNHESTTKSRSEGTATTQKGSTQPPTQTGSTSTPNESTFESTTPDTIPTLKTSTKIATSESVTPTTARNASTVTSKIVTLTSEEGSSTGTPKVVTTASEVNSSPVTTKFTESKSTTQALTTESETPKTETTKLTSVATETKSKSTTQALTTESETPNTETSKLTSVATETKSKSTTQALTTESETPKTETSKLTSVATESTKITTLKTTSTAMPTTTVACANLAGDICKTYKKMGVCNYTSIMEVCELTCNPACQTTTAFLSTSTTTPVLIYTCKPGFVKGTNATHSKPGVETCCDVIDNCDELIADANSAHNGNYKTNYDVCSNVTSGFFFSQCALSCEGCAIDNDTLSGLDTEDCHDNFNTTKACIPLLLQGYCSFLTARQNCWQTCNGCKTDVPQSFETSGAESSALRSPVERIRLGENTDYEKVEFATWKQ